MSRGIDLSDTGAIESDQQLERLLNSDIPFIDVRAPIEFNQGSIPGAVNLPLLNNDERAAVGTVYKQQGSDAALLLGHQLISGELRESRIDSWAQFGQQNPKAWIYCFRGGLRSQSVAKVLKQERGIDLPVVPGGYKRLRRTLLNAIERISKKSEFAVLSGFTGCGKTDLLAELYSNGQATCDLERAALHRGSSFGKMSEWQPSQADFENHVAKDLLTAQGRIKTKNDVIFIEDESRRIGKKEIPLNLFTQITSSPLYVIERTKEERTRYLTAQYLNDNYGLIDGVPPGEEGENFNQFNRFSSDIILSFEGIGRRLGGSDLKIFKDLANEALNQHRQTGLFASHYEWVARLLSRYYDPLYKIHLEKSKDRIVFRGTTEDLRYRLDLLRDN
jgi:tRNA 2-selenouridine synthase